MIRFNATINASNRPICSVRCVLNGTGTALVMPARNAEAMQLHLDGIAMRQNWPSNRVFKSFDDIVGHRCYGLLIPR